jgi:hypothetical protein
MEEVSILLGHSSVRITEKHYASWVQARQEILKAHVAKTWQSFGVIEGGKQGLSSHRWESQIGKDEIRRSSSDLFGA